MEEFTTRRGQWVALLVAAVLSSTVHAAEITVGTWNVRLLSAHSRDGQERSQIVDRLVAFDLVALQEVMDDSVVSILVDSLRARREAFDFIQAPAQGTPPNDERYAFLYRADRVQLVGELQTWPDPGQCSGGPGAFSWVWWRVRGWDRAAQDGCGGLACLVLRFTRQSPVVMSSATGESYACRGHTHLGCWPTRRAETTPEAG